MTVVPVVVIGSVLDLRGFFSVSSYSPRPYNPSLLPSRCGLYVLPPPPPPSSVSEIPVGFEILGSENRKTLRGSIEGGPEKVCRHCRPMVPKSLPKL